MIARQDGPWFQSRHSRAQTGSAFAGYSRSIRGMDSTFQLATMEVIGACGTNGTLRGCVSEHVSEVGRRDRSAWEQRRRSTAALAYRNWLARRPPSDVRPKDAEV